MEPASCGLGWIFSELLPFHYSADILFAVMPDAGISGDPLGAQHSTANVRVKRCWRNPQCRGGLPSRHKPLFIDHHQDSRLLLPYLCFFLYIDFTINIDNVLTCEEYFEKGSLAMSTKHEGLEGVVAASTRLSLVDGRNGRLILAGYPVEAIAPQATFEEMAHLLWQGRLPKAEELKTLKQDLASRRRLPSVTLSLCTRRRNTQLRSWTPSESQLEH